MSGQPRSAREEDFAVDEENVLFDEEADLSGDAGSIVGFIGDFSGIFTTTVEVSGGSGDSTILVWPRNPQNPQGSPRQRARPASAGRPADRSGDPSANAGEASSWDLGTLPQDPWAPTPPHGLTGIGGSNRFEDLGSSDNPQQRVPSADSAVQDRPSESGPQAVSPEALSSWGLLVVFCLLILVFSVLFVVLLESLM